MNNTPHCIAYIMDGNRRWAREQKLPVAKGHEQGLEAFENTVRNTLSFGIRHMIFYGFSTENWKRSKEEVGNLLSLMKRGFTDLKLAKKEQLRVRFIGDRARFSEEMQREMERVEGETKDNKKGSLTIALSYGGRAEIIAAVNKALAEGKTSVTEEEFEQHLWTAGIPDPDLIVRTGEAMRLSNFLTWQSVYSELYFTDTYWPDFDKEELSYILEDYASRERRKGA